MKDEEKTKEQLIRELSDARQLIAKLDLKYQPILESLGEKEKFLKDVLNSIQDGISVLDKDLKILHVNHTMEIWYRHNMPLVGKKCYEAYHSRTKPCEICPTIRTLQTGRQDVEVVPFTAEKGTIKGWLELFTFPVSDTKTGKLTGVIEYVRDITERKLAEQKLTEEKNRSEAIIAAIGDGISIQDTDFKILYQNQSLKDLIGDHVGEYCYYAYEKNDKVCEGCPVAMSFKDGKVHTVERAVNTERGTIYVENTASPLFDASGKIIAGIEVVRNITERKKTEQKIIQAEQDWKDTFNTISDMITVHDKDYNIIQANKAAEKILGLPLLTKTPGTKCFKYYHGTDHPPEGCPSCNCLRTGKPAAFEIFEPHLNAFIEIRVMPRFDQNKQFIGLIHVVRDISDRKKKEEELRKSEASYKEISDILSTSLKEAQRRETDLLNSREAFLNMLEDNSEAYKTLEDLFIGIVTVMVNLLDAKSPWTKGHSERVSSIAEKIAREMGLDEDDVKDIRLAGLLHDIGKIGTYDYLLDKPARLTEEEFEMVKKHPAKGAEILSGIKQLKGILPFIRHHHERIDGRGYPDGIKGDDIPLQAKILCVSDSFDSMTADRPYRPSPGVEYAISELKRCSGTQFDPQVVDSFLKILGQAA